jgi:hypothetical protein
MRSKKLIALTSLTALSIIFVIIGNNAFLASFCFNLSSLSFFRLGFKWLVDCCHRQPYRWHPDV